MPNNAGYYHAAYIIALAIYVLYGVSIVVRTKSLRREAEREKTQ